MGTGVAVRVAGAGVTVACAVTVGGNVEVITATTVAGGVPAHADSIKAIMIKRMSCLNTRRIVIHHVYRL